MNSKVYTQALIKADAENVTIVGYNRHNRTFLVRGSSGKQYAVKVDEHRLYCECDASRHNLYCKHRAVVRRQIIALAMHPDQVVYPYLVNTENAPQWAIEATKKHHREEMEYIISGKSMD
jgi:hypothetical protein